MKLMGKKCLITFGILGIIIVLLFIPLEREENLDSSSVTIKAGEYYICYASTRRSTMLQASDVSIIGSFTASGGTGNDIMVLIFEDDIQLQNYLDGKSYIAKYESGKVTSGNFNKALEEGQCIILFDNSFSLISSKMVQIDLTMNYKMNTLFNFLGSINS